jgi:hypothetical protein
MKHASTSPSNLATAIKTSSIKLSVANSTKLKQSEKHKLRLSLGIDKLSQKTRYAHYASSTPPLTQS